MGNAFIGSEIVMLGGVYMRVAIAAIIIFTLSLLIVACSAQTTDRFQGVGGDFGRNWISNFQAQNPPAAEENLSNDLWGWGGAPKGKALVGGKLVDATNTTNTVNFTANWLGELPQTSPIYMNSSSPYGNYGQNPNTPGFVNSAPLTPMALSDDPWVLAQQLERPVITPPGYFGTSYPYS
jgi:hypothetical protein